MEIVGGNGITNTITSNVVTTEGTTYSLGGFTYPLGGFTYPSGILSGGLTNIPVAPTDLKPDLEKLTHELRQLRAILFSQKQQLCNLTLKVEEKRERHKEQEEGNEKEKTSSLLDSSSSDIQLGLGSKVCSKATGRGPWIVIGETAKAFGDQRTVVECFLVRDKKGRDSILPKPEASLFLEESNPWATSFLLTSVCGTLAAFLASFTYLYICF